jgi:4-amino-4-deoxy-L-arabinose transferase-like glycosyltransferase
VGKPKSKKIQQPDTSANFSQSLLASLDPSRKSGGLSAKSAIVLLAGLLLILSIPFLKRPFHIDDPLFVWAARHIQDHPGNPYGFSVNWYGVSMPISDVAKNPPLASYYIALMALILGWSEPALHLVFMLAAVAVAIGTYLIANRFCAHPLLATLAGVLTPVFLVSSLTVMSDVLMLAFWVFAVHFWMKGIDEGRHSALLIGALLIAASSITKYFGMTLIPLLLMYSIFRKRAAGWWLIYLVIPIAVLGSYQWATQHLYGRGLLLDAAAYATETRTDFGKFAAAKTYVAFVFTGGCIATVLFLCRQLWSRRALICGLLFAIAAALLLANASTIGTFPLPSDRSTHLLLAVQLSLWGTAGISLILLATLDLYRRRDSESLFLFAWIVGTFLFAGFINWTTNGRSVLPLTIPAGIVIARRLELGSKGSRNRMLPATIAPLVASLVLSFAVAWADTTFAGTARAAATRIHDSYGAQRTVWFQGHWGFQYYMEQMGAKPVDVKEFRAAVGDVVAVPTTNTNLFEMPASSPLKESFDVTSTPWIATMNYPLGAGFYADVFGPLPFVVGPVAPERFTIFEIKQ